MKLEKVIKNVLTEALIVINLGIIFVSCNSNQGNVELREEPRIATKSLKTNDETVPSKTVEMFMKLIEQNKLDEAMSLFAKDENTKSETAKIDNDKPTTFNWAKSLSDRNLSLKKVLDEKVKDTEAFVQAELYVKDSPAIVTVSEFQLTKKSNEWKLSAIKLIKD